ncbi:MAG TPA: HAD family hydrolase [Verrucomicrobiae bacterium]|nr:HAD family hydrolase [Verrucomicrobiae bacterium]
MGRRLLVCDIDGTLVDDTLTLDDRDVRAVARAQAAGTLVGVATGRMYRSALPFADRLDVALPVICYQGAVIRDRPRPGDPLSPLTGTRLGRLRRECGVGPGLAREVLALATARGWTCNVYQDDQLLVAADTPAVRYYTRIARVPITVADDLADRLGRGSTKMVVVVEPNQAVFAAVVAEVGELVGARGVVTRSYPGFCEVTAPGVDKGTALAWVAASVGAALTDVVAVGDAPNDLALLATAGTAVAVRTAAAEVRTAADWITGAPGEGGIAAVVERYQLDDAAAA